MEKKLKKQRKRLVIRISGILLAVWLILSCAYAVVAFFDEKERACDDAQIAFSALTDAFSQPYNSLFAIDEARKTALNVSHTYTDGKSSRTDASYQDDVNALVLDPKTKQKTDFGDIINTVFTATTVDPEYRETHFGYLSFSSFRDSMTDEQYDKLLSYLDRQPEDDSYYELVCTEFYQNSEDQLLPKTVQIVSTKDIYKWYVQDTQVETFDLDPEGVEGLSLYRISYLNRNEIPEEFIRNTVSCNHLIKTAQRLANEKTDDPQQSSSQDNARLLQESFSSYIYYNDTTVTAMLQDYTYEELVKMAEDNTIAEQKPYEKKFDVYYAKRIDVLKGCKRNILTAAGILFLFFLMIGVILTVMMWKSLKTQMLEEQKRRDMTNALAHDIKTPLFILSGYAVNLKENVQTEKRDHYADVIVEQSQEINRRVNRILELSKLDSPDLKLDKQEIDLTELVAQILSNYEVLPDSKQIEFSDRTSSGQCMVSADRSLMKRAVENLIDNAVKYADPDTVIHISVTNHAFEITNTCAAIDGSDFKTLTDPYVRADRSRTSGGSVQGTGLGLSIVKTVCSLHKMKLNALNRHDSVTFTITLH